MTVAWGNDPDPFEGLDSIPIVADDNKPCDTCGKVHTDSDPAHSEGMS
jgi:hypothetical protein